MLVSYKKLVEVVIRHDYYLPPGNPAAEWPDNYTILNDLEIIPSPECARALKNARMVFRTSALGFQLFIQVEKQGNDYIAFIPVEQDVKWTFYLRLRNPFWGNFTNQRLKETQPFQEAKSNLYYFNNLSGTAEGINLFLSRALPTYQSTYPGDSSYLLGDLILRANNNKKVFEAIENGIAPNSPFVAAKWQDTGFSAIHFVNPNDRIASQPPAFVYTRPNTQPGETVQFSLKDIRNQTVELGNIPGTDQNQGTYTTPTNPNDPVRNGLSFQHLPPGKYSLAISTPSTSEPDRVFYLLDPLRDQNIFGIIELFAGNVAAGFELFNFAVPSKPVVKEKIYQIRFKNRMTKWRYLKQNNNLFHESPYQPLTEYPSKYKITVTIPGPTPTNEDIFLPDPNASSLAPETNTQGKIINIKSIIYLNE